MFTGPSRSERGSPPTQMLLRPSHDRSDSEIDGLDLSKIDEDPITYFLTPAQRLYDADNDTMDFEMDFDAGIEDAKHPAPIVRSISPSSLSSLGGLPSPCIPTPPSRSLSPDTDRDMPLTPDDHEDYMYLAANAWGTNLPFSMRNLAGGKFKTQEKKKTVDDPAQERAKTRPGRSTRRGRPRTTTFRRSPHAWREPSPDVWSIEEETEEELHSDSAMEGDLGNNVRGIEIPAAKPKKRVRFALPDEA